MSQLEGEMQLFGQLARFSCILMSKEPQSRWAICPQHARGIHQLHAITRPPMVSDQHIK